MAPRKGHPHEKVLTRETLMRKRLIEVMMMVRMMTMRTAAVMMQNPHKKVLVHPTASLRSAAMPAQPAGHNSAITSTRRG